MNKKHVVIVSALTILFAAVLFSMNALQSSAKTTAVPAGKASQTSVAASWEYSRLQVSGKSVTWMIGDINFVVRTQTVSQLNLQLGGKQPNPSFSSLLNTIGDNGWELVQISGSTWIFKRAA